MVGVHAAGPVYHTPRNSQQISYLPPELADLIGRDTVLQDYVTILNIVQCVLVNCKLLSPS